MIFLLLCFSWWTKSVRATRWYNLERFLLLRTDLVTDQHSWQWLCLGQWHVTNSPKKPQMEAWRLHWHPGDFSVWMPSDRRWLFMFSLLIFKKNLLCVIFMNWIPGTTGPNQKIMFCRQHRPLQTEIWTVFFFFFTVTKKMNHLNTFKKASEWNLTCL